VAENSNLRTAYFCDNYYIKNLCAFLTNGIKKFLSYVEINSSQSILYRCAYIVNDIILSAEPRRKGWFKGHKTFVSTTVTGQSGILHSPASAGFWIEFKIKGLDFMAAECQMSKCRARCRLIVEKLWNPETKVPKKRYRFTPSFLGRDTRCEKPFQFRFQFGLHMK